jgi:hypothetical protein
MLNIKRPNKKAHILTTTLAHQAVKLIAAATGETMTEVTERLALEEWERVKDKEVEESIKMVYVKEATE